MQTHIHKNTYGNRGKHVSTQAHKCIWINRYTYIDMYTHMISTHRHRFECRDTRLHIQMHIYVCTCTAHIHKLISTQEYRQYLQICHLQTQTRACRHTDISHTHAHLNSCYLPLQLNRIIGENKTRQVLHQKRGIQEQIKARKENIQNHYLCKSSYYPSSRITK